jgi:dihydrofolate synthase/folylpolyglutamate synthase
MGIEKLDKYINNENLTVYDNYTLESIRTLLAEFGNPQDSLNIIHIAGTNGKGSVAFMLNSICIEAGYKTGLFTSPHLLRINERIKIDNREISANDLDKYSDESYEVIENHGEIEPTFFDIITQIALKYFRDMGTEIVILETGLGGRLDSTNVVKPLVSIITDISLDHTSTLGDTIKSIVAEKAGIIKKMTPVVTTNTQKETVTFLAERSEEMGAAFFSYNRDFRAEKISHTGKTLSYDYSIAHSDFDLKLEGITLNTYADFQVRNSSAAITSALILKNRFPKINNEVIIRGLSETKFPGRFQVLSEDPLIIFDPAHNREALISISEILKKHFASKNITVIVSLMKDKDYINILDTINQLTGNIIYFQQDDRRGYRPLEEKDYMNIPVIVETKDDLLKELIKKNEKNSLYFFTGSFRLYKLASECAEKL